MRLPGCSTVHMFVAACECDVRLRFNKFVNYMFLDVFFIDFFLYQHYMHGFHGSLELQINDDEWWWWWWNFEQLI